MISELVRRCPCGDRAADGRAMCLPCMEAQLSRNRDSSRWKAKPGRPVEIEETRGLYDYAMTRADQEPSVA